MASIQWRKCSICSEEFNQPKILPCFHSFCQRCLDNLIKKDAHLNKFNCPRCRTEIDVPQEGASGFVANFYIGEKPICPKHEAMGLKFYCRDCSKPICHDCVVVDHELHNKADLKEVGKEAMEALSTLKLQIERMVDKTQTLSKSLTLHIHDITKSATRACSDVDKQVEKICSTARKQGDDVKVEIHKIEEEEVDKVRKLLDDVMKLQEQLLTSVQCSDDVLKTQATIPALDILPQVRTMSEDETLEDLELPEIRYPHFPPVEINLQALKQQLGELKTMDAQTFTLTFDVGLILANDPSYSGNDGGVASDLIQEKDFRMQGMQWRVRVRVKQNQDDPQMDIFLFLKKAEDATVKSCTASFNFKLLSTSDDSKSVVKKSHHTFVPDGDGKGWANFITASLIRTNKTVGNDKKVILQTNVAIQNIERY
ncbi:tripartite motif-containing protein 2 [Patella vulgata]|uniref:tripartite motif-containing protein 2 n=1 Tax=Patella vulgata TaxID=6465 RepID=UPI00217FB448|nr:tripartite motif-containing protein 2 [Patella vulgata]